MTNCDAQPGRELQVLEGHEAGNEVQAPMGVVILGGLLTSTTLNMLVLPVLFRIFGRAPAKPLANAPA